MISCLESTLISDFFIEANRQNLDHPFIFTLKDVHRLEAYYQKAHKFFVSIILTTF
jgi:hypothetical protein